MTSHRDWTHTVYGPKCFQANLPPMPVERVLQRIYERLRPINNRDTGGPAWRMDRNRSFVSDNPNGQYFLGTGGYKVAKQNGMVSMRCESIAYDNLATSIAVNFVDNMDWMAPAEDLISATMRDIDQVIVQLAGRRRWVMLTGGWRTGVLFQTHAKFDEVVAQPVPDEPRPQGPPWTSARRFTYPIRTPIRAIAEGIQEIFDDPRKRDWKAQWYWNDSASNVKCVSTRDARRRAAAKPLTPEGAALLRSPVDSPEPAKLDLLFRTVFTIDIDEQADGNCLIQSTFEETIDPDFNYNHFDIRPESFIDRDFVIATTLRSSLRSLL